MNRLFLVLLIFCFSSCQEEVTLPLGTKSELVPTIEAYWTDQGSFNEVKFTLSKDYYDSSEVVEIADAEVFITIPGTEKVVPFGYFGGTKSYKPINPLEKAEVGETYQLNVRWGENTYISEGVMLEPPTVDSITWSFEEERSFREQGYYVKVYGKIPFENDNNYRIRVIENDTLKNQREDYLLFDDTFGLAFFEEGLELGYSFQENDRVRLELFRLNQDAFDYLNQLVNLLFSDGGLFSPPPQNPDTNIRVVSGNPEVLGYFIVSPVLSRSLVIQAKYD
ncbi:DUF4249 family protein [Algoriphagus boritolerans]|uniref:DUF4249 domain-containing protein n=1 Tax=Algoriphagus boritolerans DSM 17298 = JCM 18970 TaxID=1120964 RepID=A0A1H5VP92_9BACT|nr:DUF4249 family protein [Algoriphagus boritolerans]SEF89064.1 protein of unknown function [Algoriphagus boritolerans DSM 17298 = JCM 18970]